MYPKHYLRFNNQFKYPRVNKNYLMVPSFVRIVEVGPRDGLQNIKKIIPTTSKIEFINLLSSSGLKVIEATSFVHKNSIPQMTDSFQVFTQIKKVHGVSYPVLVPNKKGLDLALLAGANEIAIPASASETFSLKNINKTIHESLEIYQSIAKEANRSNMKVRGYISCALGCPYEGEIKPKVVVDIAQKLLTYGCYEISLGDTIGVGTPQTMETLIHLLIKSGVSIDRLAVHCHDTYGRALSNITKAISLGVKVVDSSIYGLGGCPYAKGSSGNVATEKVVYHLNHLGIQTNIDMDKLIKARNYITNVLSILE